MQKLNYPFRDYEDLIVAYYITAEICVLTIIITVMI